jgi:molybdopterin molybdotransferase
MISVKQAIDIVRDNSVSKHMSELKIVSEALSYVLYKNVKSPINMPPFRQSAMDGYAVNLHNELTYTIIGEVKAGDNHRPTLNKGEAIRIFTGAPVPDTANAVIMQEQVSINNNILTAESPITLNKNIRPLGEQVGKNEIALKKGTLLTPAAIAFITSLGITSIMVYKKPTIAIMVTGSELVTAGTPLAYGQIYESNATMLTSTLKKLGYQDITVHKVSDDYLKTVSLLNQVITNHDMVLVSGGISVGDYDFVGKALQEIGVEQLFYKVKQKPGKPLFFGKKESKIVFALPGNPAAALSCFYIYVYPALQRISGQMYFSLAKTKALSLSNYIKKGNRPQFLKAIYHDNKVEILDGQNSSMLHTFALANAIVYVPETIGTVKIDDTVEVILLPIN